MLYMVITPYAIRFSKASGERPRAVPVHSVVVIRRHVHMIESDRKKVNFLRTVLRDTNVTATVHHARIEAVAEAVPEAMAQIDVVTARALATLDDLAALMAPLINPSTIALLHKGRDWQDELTACQKNWNMIVGTHAS